MRHAFALLKNIYDNARALGLSLLDEWAECQGDGHTLDHDFDPYEPGFSLEPDLDLDALPF